MSRKKIKCPEKPFIVQNQNKMSRKKKYCPEQSKNVQNKIFKNKYNVQIKNFI